LWDDGRKSMGGFAIGCGFILMIGGLGFLVITLLGWGWGWPI